MGPRQSGKTTLSRKVFEYHDYISLEEPNEREFALADPKGFLRRFTGGVILDEIQRAPDLLSYIQGIVDRENSPGRFILTGSQQFHLMEKVSQTLAGRAAIVYLLPLSLNELFGQKTPDPREFDTLLGKNIDLLSALKIYYTRGFIRAYMIRDWSRMTGSPHITELMWKGMCGLLQI